MCNDLDYASRAELLVKIDELSDKNSELKDQIFELRCEIEELDSEVVRLEGELEEFTSNSNQYYLDDVIEDLISLVKLLCDDDREGAQTLLRNMLASFNVFYNNLTGVTNVRRH
jgi:predicted nuclease with TOPRIM domain